MTLKIIYVETLGDKLNKPEALRLHQPPVSFNVSITAASIISVCLQVGLKCIQCQCTRSLRLGYSTAASKETLMWQRVSDLMNEIM